MAKTGPESTGARAGGTGRRDVAVVTCTYRRPDRLRRAVQDVFEQHDHSGQRVIIVEDGSDDGRTDSVVETIVETYGDRVDVVRHGINRGVAAARTTGIARAAELGADLVCFHDDDDLWVPNRLSLGTAPFADPAVAMTFGHQKRISDSYLESGEIEEVWSCPSRGYWGTIADGLLRGRVYFPFQTAMFRTELAAGLLPFMPVRESEDVDFALRALRIIKRTRGLRAEQVPQLLAYHVSSVDSLSESDTNNRIREDVHRQIFRRHVPALLVGGMFTVSSRVLRPTAAVLGRARPR